MSFTTNRIPNVGDMVEYSYDKTSELWQHEGVVIWVMPYEFGAKVIVAIQLDDDIIRLAHARKGYGEYDGSYLWEAMSTLETVKLFRFEIRNSEG